MARVVSIVKTSKTTRVSEWDSDTPTKKTVRSFHNGAELIAEDSVLIIYPNNGLTNSEISVEFADLDNNYSTADIYSFTEYLCDNDFF